METQVVQKLPQKKWVSGAGGITYPLWLVDPGYFHCLKGFRSKSEPTIEGCLEQRFQSRQRTDTCQRHVATINFWIWAFKWLRRPLCSFRCGGGGGTNPRPWGLELGSTPLNTKVLVTDPLIQIPTCLGQGLGTWNPLL